MFWRSAIGTQNNCSDYLAGSPRDEQVQRACYKILPQLQKTGGYGVLIYLMENRKSFSFIIDCVKNTYLDFPQFN